MSEKLHKTGQIRYTKTISQQLCPLTLINLAPRLYAKLSNFSKSTNTPNIVRNLTHQSFSCSVLLQRHCPSSSWPSFSSRTKEGFTAMTRASCTPWNPTPSHTACWRPSPSPAPSSSWVKLHHLLSSHRELYNVSPQCSQTQARWTRLHSCMARHYWKKHCCSCNGWLCFHNISS